MNRRFAITLVLTSALMSTLTSAYELATHGLLTLRAFQVSKLGSTTALQANLGIDVLTIPQSTFKNPLGANYLDMGSELRLRSAEGSRGKYEQGFMPDGALLFFRDKDTLKLESWLMRGAIREDDFPGTPFWTDDPVNAIRPLNHFYDPAHNLPLTVGGRSDGVKLGSKNPDWALGTLDVFADPNSQDASRLNHYSIVDAHEAMWRALTLRDKQGATLVAAGSLTKPEDIRKAYWATAFRSLGDAVHLIQDMAQPQHARNEPHSGLGLGVVQASMTGHGSVYEKYADARAAGNPIFDVNVGNGSPPIRIGISTALVLDGYPPPTFNRYADFFTTSPGSDLGPGFGMADYANRRFFTQVKNLGNSDFRLPSNDPADYPPCLNPDGTNVVAKAWDGTPLSGGIKVELLCAKEVIDEQNPTKSAVKVPLTSWSIWDQFLQEEGKTYTYHLVRENYDAQADLLLPRAVAYSAGLLDYFFRGQMTISLPDSGVYGLVDHAVFAGDGVAATDVSGFKGFAKIRLKLVNTTPDISAPDGVTYPQAIGAGTLVAVMKFHRNGCYKDDLTGQAGAPGIDMATCRTAAEEIVVSQPKDVTTVPSNAPIEYEFTFDQELPINATDAYLQVVFRGYLGRNRM